MTPEEREVRRKRLQEAARAALEAMRKEEDEILLAKFKDASHGTKSIAMCLLETKRAAELSLINTKIAIQILLVQNGQNMVDWDNLTAESANEEV
jgi:hypothetical protein